jgi:hypothetical protein
MTNTRAEDGNCRFVHQLFTADADDDGAVLAGGKRNQREHATDGADDELDDTGAVRPPMTVIPFDGGSTVMNRLSKRCTKRMSLSGTIAALRPSRPRTRRSPSRRM